MDILSIAFEGVLGVLVAVVMVTTVGAIRNLKDGSQRLLQGHLFMAAVYLLLDRLFIYLVESGVYALDDIVFHIYWHMIFYFFLLTFVVVGIGQNELEAYTKVQTKPFLMTGAVIHVVMLGITAAIFIFGQGANQVLVQAYGGSTIDAFGVHHFVALILAVLAVGVFFASSIGENRQARARAYFLAMMVFFSLQQGWELVTESWRLVRLDSEVIELVEKLVTVLPGFVLFLLGTRAVRKEGRE